ncbi:hypothetical protein ACN47E_006935 [Coniothyrium glycines]
MASHSRFLDDMPGIYTPSPSHPRSGSRPGYFDPAPHFTFAPETSGRQVTGLGTHETRKRSRNGGLDSSTVQNSTTSFWGQHSLEDARFDNTRSPAPLANDRYTLAGGGMIASQQFTRQIGDYDDYFQLQKQRENWSVPPTPYNSMPRRVSGDAMQSTPDGGKSWSILGLVGGVAGKLFQFCSVPFRGFQAGNGQKYNMDMQGEVAAKLGLQDDLFSAGPAQIATPGGFSANSYGVQSIDSVGTERPRMAKRLRTADNWVMIGNDGEAQSRPATPRLSERRIPDHVQSPSQIPRPISRASTTPSSLKRPSLIPVSRRSTMDRRSFYGSSKPPSHTRQHSYNRQSLGSPVIVDKDAQKPKSPLPKESQRLINKVRREEMEEDARMRRMSSQMSAMLKEAKEALGSKFEVEEYDDDDHSIEDGGSVQQPSWFS